MDDFKYILTYLSTVTLQYAPDGWNESSIKNERSDTYFGMFRSYTSSPVKFVKDGALIVRTAFYDNGLEADVKLEIQRLNKQTLVYESIFFGELDFSTFKDFDTYCEVGIIEGGISKYIKLNEETEYTFNIKDISNAKFEYIKQGSNPPEVFAIYYLNAQHLLFALLDKMADGKFTSHEFNQAAGSFWYTICYGTSIRLAITTGKAIRWGMTTADPGTIKTSFKDFYNAINSIYCIGCGVEIRDNIETFVWYDRSYFYNSANLIQNIGDISSVNVSVAKDFIYSTIKVGYTAQEYTVMSNYNEPNTEISFKAPITRLTKEYDIINKYRGDFTGIDEILSDTTSESADEEIFLIMLKLNVGVFDQPEGGWVRRNMGILPPIDVNSNNVRISPGRCLLNHLPFLMSGYDRLTNDVIKFTASANPLQDLPDHMQTSLDLVNFVDESADIAITTDQMFLPYIFEIEDYALSGLINAFMANRPGIIQFMNNGIQYEGFIIDSTIKLIGKGTVNFKLLATTNNDMTNLIR